MAHDFNQMSREEIELVGMQPEHPDKVGEKPLLKSWVRSTNQEIKRLGITAESEYAAADNSDDAGNSLLEDIEHSRI
jgi:hypothetical protein